MALTLLILLGLAGLLTFLTWKYLVIPMADGFTEMHMSHIRKEIKEEERAQLLEDYLKEQLESTPTNL